MTSRSPGRPSEPPRATLVARQPEDLLALVPVVLGFHPEESLVLLTFGPRPGFHARVDLPASLEELPTLVEVLEEPIRRTGVTRAALVAYSTHPQPAEAVLGGVAEALGARGVEVLALLRADGGRWFSLAGPGDPDGVPYDIGGHRFLADAVLRGEVTHASREALAATLATDLEGAARVDAAVAARHRLGAQHQRPSEGAWVRVTVREAVESGRRLDDADAARLLVAMLDRWVRDEALALLGRDTAHQHARLWLDLVRRAPDGLVAAPAALLGFASWLSGHGAEAWCAVERAEHDEPGYALTGYLAVALQHGLPPTVWDDAQSGALPGPSSA